MLLCKTTRRDAMLLVSVRNSRPIFKVDQYRIALLADSEELRASHEYIEVLARQQGANVRAFRDEASALDWLAAPAR